MTDQNENQQEFKSKNINFCAYLMMNEVAPSKVNKLGRGRGEFVYTLEPSRWDTLKLNFSSSEFRKYSHCIEAVKDLCY